MQVSPCLNVAMEILAGIPSVCAQHTVGTQEIFVSALCRRRVASLKLFEVFPHHPHKNYNFFKFYKIKCRFQETRSQRSTEGPWGARGNGLKAWSCGQSVTCHRGCKAGCGQPPLVGEKSGENKYKADSGSALILSHRKLVSNFLKHK